MNLNKMKYKSYIFKYNPREIKIQQVRNIREFKLPIIGSFIQDLGLEKRIVTGSGDFFGRDYLKQFEDLRNLSLVGDSGYLSIPGITPFKAFFKRLEVSAKPQPNLLSYTFEFWEDTELKTPKITNFSPGYHTVIKGETLWDIAERYNTSAYILMKLNPEIKRPDNLTPGQRVVIE